MNRNADTSSSTSNLTSSETCSGGTSTPARRRRWAMIVKTGALTLLLSVLATVGAVGAEARVVQTVGRAGPSAPGWVNCSYHNYTGNLTVTSGYPAVLAYDYYAGYGNDWQLVRYRIVWYSSFSGQLLGTSGWSGFAWAGDASLAQWTGGGTSMSFRYDAQVMVGVQIQFYNQNGTYEGYVSHIRDAYQNYQEDQRAGVSYGRCVSSWGNI